MKYSYDKKFRKIAFSLPFSPLSCKLSKLPLHIIGNLIKPAKSQNLKINTICIKAYKNLSIKVKQIIPKNPNDFAILDLHGGGFGYKAAPHQIKYAFEYSEKLQCQVFFPDYHLLPDFPFPAAFEDSLKTYEYIVNHSEELKINPEKIIVLGDSAGGTLAANICNMAYTKDLPTPCGQVLIYPATDNQMNTNSMKEFTSTPLWNAKNNSQLWPLYLKNVTAEEEKIAVPMQNPLPQSLPKTYIETAQFDCLRDQAFLYAKKIQPISKSLEINQTMGTIHGYDMLTSHPTSKASLKKRIDFMQEIMMIKN